MKITIRYFGQLRNFTKMASESREFAEGRTLNEALQDVAKDYDEGFGRIVFDEEGMVRRSLMVVHNETPVNRHEMPELADGDEISLLTAIAGG
jgi:molybdopterin converting factor small subunit